jgi:hypothetical protein
MMCIILSLFLGEIGFDGCYFDDFIKRLNGLIAWLYDLRWYSR